MESVSPAQFGVFFACLLVLLGAIATALKIFRREPPLHREFASRESHEALVGRVDDIEEQIRAGFEHADEKRSKSIGNLHEKLENELKDVNQRMDELPDRIVTRLREMRGLFRE